VFDWASYGVEVSFRASKFSFKIVFEDFSVFLMCVGCRDAEWKKCPARNMIAMQLEASS
jgi:hypothetical protein